MIEFLSMFQQQPVLSVIYCSFSFWVLVVSANDNIATSQDSVCQVTQKKSLSPEETLEGRGVFVMQNPATISALVDRNEPFVWRNCFSRASPTMQWWDDDSNLVREEGDTVIRVRAAPRKSMEHSTLYQRFAGKDSYHHVNMTLWEFFESFHDDGSSSEFQYYAAQLDLTTLQDLINHLPSLPFEDELGEIEQQTIYIGGGTKTQLHYDSRENFVCALSGGTKRFVLYDPVTSASLLYINAERYGNTSPIESLSTSDSEMMFPMSKYALPVTVTLQTGDCLYIPIYWFHSVETPKNQKHPTISVNWWFRPDEGKKDIIGRLLCGQAHRKASAQC